MNQQKRIAEAAKKSGSNCSRAYAFTYKNQKVYSFRSVHVNKDSREQFEMRVHRRMIELVNSTDKAISSLTSVHLPAGVGIEIKQV